MIRREVTRPVSSCPGKVSCSRKRTPARFLHDTSVERVCQRFTDGKFIKISWKTVSMRDSAHFSTQKPVLGQLNATKTCKMQVSTYMLQNAITPHLNIVSWHSEILQRFILEKRNSIGRRRTWANIQMKGCLLLISILHWNLALWRKNFSNMRQNFQVYKDNQKSELFQSFFLHVRNISSHEIALLVSKEQRAELLCFSGLSKQKRSQPR